MKFLALMLVLFYVQNAYATSHPVLLSVEKLESQCQGTLSPDLQALVLSDQGTLLGRIDKIAVIRFDSIEKALNSAGRENNCVRLGNYVHTYDDVTQNITYEASGIFKGVICSGSCPGFNFETFTNQTLWVDPVSLMDLLGYTNVLNKKWDLGGIFKFQTVYMENPNEPRRYKEILYLKTIKPKI